ncbi:MAG: hypothetical protein ACI4AE_04665 [Candidatus Cryptobacteroides sp.]
MKAFLAALLLIGLGVLGMCFNVIFRKKDFPQFDVGNNEEMRKKGIRCMREEDDERFSGKQAKKDGVCSGTFSESCKGCGLYPFEHKEDKQQ